jgi:hypothetical protein
MRISDCGVNGLDRHQDIERIKAIIAEKRKQYEHRGGEVVLAGVEGTTIKIAPAGFCWR